MSEPESKSQALNATIDRYVDELATATDQARISTAMQAYLDTCARFHRYSWHNTLLILLARPDATAVAGYNRWASLKRHVRKGERGIPILAPIFVKTDRHDAEGVVLKGFKVAYVFDISQTDGEPLPPAPDWSSPERNEALQQRLTRLAEDLGIQVTVEVLPGSAQGVSRGKAIALSPQAGTATLIHELAHELLHRDDRNRPPERHVREAEAEAVAYVVGRHFGLQGLNSPNYLALWKADSKLLRAQLTRINQGRARLSGRWTTTSRGRRPRWRHEKPALPRLRPAPRWRRPALLLGMPGHHPVQPRAGHAIGSRPALPVSHAEGCQAACEGRQGEIPAV